MAELNYYDRKRVHNLKYYTWVEQQGRDMHELNDLWYGSTWDDVHRQAAAWMTDHRLQRGDRGAQAPVNRGKQGDEGIAPTAVTLIMCRADASSARRPTSERGIL